MTNLRKKRLIQNFTSITYGTLYKLIEMPEFYILKEDVIIMIQFLESRSSQISNFHLYKKINAIGEPEIVSYLFDENEVKGFKGQLQRPNERRYAVTNKKMKFAQQKSSCNKGSNLSTTLSRHSLVSPMSNNQSLLNKRNLMISKSKNKSECTENSIMNSGEEQKTEFSKQIQINTSQDFSNKIAESNFQSPAISKRPQSTKNQRNIKKLELMKGKVYEPRLDFEDFCEIEFKTQGYPEALYLFIYLVFGEDIFEYFVRYILKLDKPDMYYTFSNNYGLYLRKINS